MKKILWATDFSPHAHDAGRQALECAACSEQPVDILTVVDPDDMPLFLLDVPDPFMSPQAVHAAERELRTEHDQAVRSELAEEARLLTDTGVEVRLHVRVGSPTEEILNAASELGSDLIVMGSHGKRSLEELLLGSTVENVTRHAPCPVLVVR